MEIPAKYNPSQTEDKYEANVGQINVGGPKLTFPMGGGNGNRN